MEENFHFESVNGLAKALGGRIDLLEKIFGKKVRDNLKYSDIQKIVKSGFASEFFDLGDEIMTKYTATDGTVYDFPWRIVDFRDVYWENDPTPHPGMVLQGKYATVEAMPYSEGLYEEVTSDETIVQEGWYYYGTSKTYINNKAVLLNLEVGSEIPHENYAHIFKSQLGNKNLLISGCSDYDISNVHQWLNSAGEIGQWWTSKIAGYKEPVAHSEVNGFMRGFEKEFLEVISPVRVVAWDYATADGHLAGTKTVYDYFYLPSVVEMYAWDEDSIYFGGAINPCYDKTFAYWKKIVGTSKPSASANENRIFYSLSNHSNAVKNRTRSHSKIDGFNTFVIQIDGNCASPTNNAESDPCTPVCVIS